MIGMIISHYKILEKLGEGGMGVVYKAQDTKLDRTVALKFLPEHVSVGSADLERFTQEAKAAAGLNHPNICTIHGIEESDGKNFIVMEFVDGQMLQEKKSTLSTKQALDIGIQIAEGLAAAHEKGIVHRDIKPENIMIRKDGRVQIMDFGLAKLRGASRLTKEGSTVGTAGYMSPEQVQGQETDHRSDIFSLGVLLYEMLTGQPPFKGVHETAISYEIVNVDTPPMSTIKPEIPPELDAIILECLEKDPAERSQSSSQIALDLKRLRRESSRQRRSRITAALPASGIRQAEAPQTIHTTLLESPFIRWMMIAVLGVAACIFGYLYFAVPTPKLQTIRSSIIPPENVTLKLYGNEAGPAVVSPDGEKLAFAASDSTGKRFLYVQELSSLNPRQLAGTEQASDPFWSPDSRFIGFSAQGQLKKVSATGGVPLGLCGTSVYPRGGSWNAEGMIAFSPGTGNPILAVSAKGGTPFPVTELDASTKENSHRWPWFLPDGKHFLYLARSVSTGAQSQGDAICLGSIEGGLKKVLVHAGSNPVYASGYLLYARGTTVVAQKFDPDSFELGDESITLADGVTFDNSINRSMFTASETGILLYQTGAAHSGSRLLFQDRNGRRSEFEQEEFEYYMPRLSPDGKKISIYVYDQKTHNADLWNFDLSRNLRTRFTFAPSVEIGPVWSPDGETIAYSANPKGLMDLYQKRSAGAGKEEPLYENDQGKVALDWSGDGKYVLFASTDSTNQTDLWVLPLAKKGEPILFLKSEFNEWDGRFSPDSRWIAYTSDESGRDQIYIRSFPDKGSKWQVSISGGESPRWRRDGKELYYVSSENMMMSARITASGSDLEIDQSRPLFPVPLLVQVGGKNYDVTADGNRFLLNVPVETQNQTPLTIVTNWTWDLHK